MEQRLPPSEDDKRLARYMDGERQPDLHKREAVWIVWYKRHSGRLLPYMKYRAGGSLDESTLHHTLQEAVIISYRKVLRGDFRYQRKTFSSFVKRIALRGILAHFQRDQQNVSLDADEQEYTSELLERLTATPSFDSDDEIRLMKECIQRLDEDKRSMFHFWLKGYTLQEIAVLQGISYEALRKRYQRACGELRVMMGAGFDGKG